MNLKEIRTSLERKKGLREEVLTNLSVTRTKKKNMEREIEYTEEARTIIQCVAKETQKQLQFHISDIVTMALETIFDNPYVFDVEFEIKRGKTECKLSFKKGKDTLKPMDESAGGVINVASFALRIALWTLQTPKSSNTIILDEPFHFLSQDMVPRTSILLKKLSEKLNLQFIISTAKTGATQELSKRADKVFQVKMVKGVTNIDAV